MAFSLEMVREESSRGRILKLDDSVKFGATEVPDDETFFLFAPCVFTGV